VTTPDLRTLLPHAGGALLLDAIVEMEPDTLTAQATIREHARFSGADGVGAWIGLELMAQAAAALAGHDAVRAGGRVRPGFLLGTRRYSCSHPRFPLGATISVRAHREDRGANGVALYGCSITGDGVTAEATLVVYQPERTDALLDGVSP